MSLNSDCPRCEGTGTAIKLFEGEKKCPECYPNDESMPGGRVYDDTGHYTGQRTIDSKRIIATNEEFHDSGW